MSVAVLTAIPWQFFNDDGSVMAGGTINFYTPGTTSAKTIWEDNAKSTSAANPQTLDAAGRWDTGGLFFDGLYDLLIKDSDGNTKFSVSNWGTTFSSGGTSGNACMISNGSFETAGTGSEAVANFTETDPGALITRDTSDQSHGAASLLFTGSANGAEYVTSDIFALDELKDVQFAFDIKASNANCNPQVKMNWFDAAQSSISTATVYNGNGGDTPTSWERKVLTATPATNAAYGKLILVGNAATTTYNTYFDNVCLSQPESGATNYTAGQVIRPKFGYSSTTAITIGAGAYHHSGTTEQTVSWASQLTFTLGSGGSNSGSTNLGANQWHYIYIDDSAVVTLGSSTLTAAEFINTTTAPTYSHSKSGWYSGNDRCILAVRTGGSSTILTFDCSYDTWAFSDEVEDLTPTDIDTSWTDVTLTVPSFAYKVPVHCTVHTAAGEFFHRVNGSSVSNGAVLVACESPDGGTTNVVFVDSSGIFEVKGGASDTSKVQVSTIGYFFPEGM